MPKAKAKISMLERVHESGSKIISTRWVKIPAGEFLLAGILTRRVEINFDQLVWTLPYPVADIKETADTRMRIQESISKIPLVIFPDNVFGFFLDILKNQRLKILYSKMVQYVFFANALPALGLVLLFFFFLFSFWQN